MVMIVPPSKTRSAAGEAARAPAPGPRERVTARNPAAIHPKNRRARIVPTTFSAGYEEPDPRVRRVQWGTGELLPPGVGPRPPGRFPLHGRGRAEGTTVPVFEEISLR